MSARPAQRVRRRRRHDRRSNDNYSEQGFISVVAVTATGWGYIWGVGDANNCDKRVLFWRTLNTIIVVNGSLEQTAALRAAGLQIMIRCLY